MHWVDRLTQPIAPRWTLRRMRARAVGEFVARHYEASSPGRRTMGWHRSAGDANQANAAGLHRLRENARDLIRNNSYAAAALDTIVDHTVSWGIGIAQNYASRNRVATDRWRQWAETPVCDADGRLDFAGLQKLVMRAIAESGEVLVRRRWRLPSDGLPIPLQLQVLEADFLDTSKDGIATETGGRIIQGVEFNQIGRRIAYWLFPEHPGSSFLGVRTVGMTSTSQRISATEILHVFRPARPGQVRGVSWFAPVLLRLKDFDDYEDAALMKQKIAACLAVITTDVDGTAPPLGTEIASRSGGQPIDMLEPGVIANVSPGRDIHVVNPPTVSEHSEYSNTILRAVATGLGISFEDLTGNYQGLPFSAARMSRIRSWARIEDWRWRLLVPQFCDPVFSWAMQAAGMMGLEDAPPPEWTAPPMPMIEPAVEGLAYQRLLRIGAITWPEMLRERGYSPEAVLAEIKAWNAKFDQAGVILDSDPRKTTQQGNRAMRESARSAAPPSAPAASTNGTNRHTQRDDELARAFRLLERALGDRPPSVTISEGAIQTHIAAAPAPPPAEVHVDVAPPQLTIAEGAIHVEVDAPTTIAEGAVHVTPPTPGQVTVVRSRPNSDGAAHDEELHG